MKEREDVFERFHKSFSNMEGHFHILEQRVPVETQLEYFKYSEQLRHGNTKESAKDNFNQYKLELFDKELSAERKKFILSSLAVSNEVQAYRALEEYVQQPDPDVTDWAYMALMESRISLESELSEEKQIYISTGLGGKGEKLRFYALILASQNRPFQDYERQTIERELSFWFDKSNCEIERLTIGEQYVELLFLIPIRTDVKFVLEKVIDECNQYGGFLSKLFTITNVKELSILELEEIIEKKYGNDKTSD